MKTPRKLSLVRLDPSRVPPGFRRKYPFQSGKVYVFIGEIPNMPGHCIVANQSGKMFVGYHTEHFVEIENDQV